MGLGGAPGEWDDYEWVRLPDLPVEAAGTKGGRGGRSTRPAVPPPTEPLAQALCAWLERNPLWEDGPGPRVLLVDLDNLRADPVRWRARMAVAVALGRRADVVALAGQRGPAERAVPHLAELGGRVRAVPDGSDLADHALLAEAAAVPDGQGLQFVVMSNDNIFADLAGRGRLVVASPGADALSERLDVAADDVVDLAALERSAVPQL